MKLKIKRLTNTPLPKFATPASSGLDLYSTENFTLSPHQTHLFPVGIAIEPDINSIETQIRPRSSMAARGLLVHFGTIDNDYRGELKVVITNLNTYDVTIGCGDKIAQLVPAQTIYPELEEVDELSETKRGTGGFGSTGK